MRKFTTEIFDTGVVLVCYIGLLLWYDVKIALLSRYSHRLHNFAAEAQKPSYSAPMRRFVRAQSG